MRALLGSQKSQLSPIKFKLDLIVIVVELRYSGSTDRFPESASSADKLDINAAELLAFHRWG